MISEESIAEFLARDLFDSDYLKDLSPDEIEAKIASLPVAPVWETIVPMRHQKIGFYICIKKKKWLLFFDPGTGKTATSLHVVNYLRATEGLQRALVLVPNTSNIETWVRETKKHTPSLTIAGLNQESRAEKEEWFHSGSNVVAMTYAGWMSFVCDKAANRVKRSDEDKGYVINEKRALSLERQFQAVIFDESTALKNRTSLTYRLARRFVHTTPYRYALTGTPFGKDPIDLWSQFHVIDDGETLSSSIGLYRNVFFKEKKNYFSGYPEWVFDKKKKENLYRTIRNRSLRYKSTECFDLPKQNWTNRYCGMSMEARTYYDKVVEDVWRNDGVFHLMKNHFINMRQITAGFMTLVGAEGEKHTIVFKDNPKLDALIEMVKELPPEEKFIIFHYYQQTGDIIKARLKKEKIEHISLYGGSTDSERRTIESKFNDDKKVRCLVGSEAAAFGLNLQNSAYSFFYESPTSPIRRGQMEGRTWRLGQERPVFYTDFLCVDSVDEKVQKSLKEGEDLFAAIADGKKKARELVTKA